jgi:hypothetical protein
MQEKDLFGEPIKPNPGGGALARAFMVPPFSVLSARDGWWQERKRAWIALGIKSELGRGEVQGSMASARAVQKGEVQGSRASARTTNCGLGRRSAPGGSPMPAPGNYDGRRSDGAGREIPEDGMETWVVSSVFDPVICEIAYRWFCKPGGVVLDPFAGGSVRGIVASVLGNPPVGVDLRVEQVIANRAQAEKICSDPLPTWICGDSRDPTTLLAAGKADILFSCPPYGDLEVYSDDPLDLSTMSFERFAEAYAEIIKRSAAQLRQNRFAVFVVGDFRDKKTGAYRNFPGRTITAFADAGMQLYNDAILVTAVGSLPVRTTKQFQAGRKLGKTHQNILVFVKGDGKIAAQACRENDDVEERSLWDEPT